ncbi:unnamed protein product [Adineta ricciae]|uniref:Uncharacterized protein n=1 Tax=Adineta ricciae TaxID=249248 RepID=A0A815DP87_ADIRI|nr:unnamed protein product [Adineta ricciae]
MVQRNFNQSLFYYRTHSHLITSLLFRNTTPNMDLLHAADCGRLSIVKELVSKDKSLLHNYRHKDASNRAFNLFGSPIHYACRSGHFNVVKYLLEQDVTLVEDVDVEQWTPLHYACNNGHLNIVKLLTEYNANVRAKDNYLNQTPIQFAMYRNFEDVVHFLDPHIRWERRTADEISKKGNVSAFRKNSTLFLARYVLNNDHVERIETFRANPDHDDIDLDHIQDNELKNLPVRLRLTHDSKRHLKKTQELSSTDTDDQFLRSSTTSTNEHLMVFDDT